MPMREYTCPECRRTFEHDCRGRPRVCCEDCAPIRKKRQITEWYQTQTPEQRRAAYERNRASIAQRAARWNSANRERRAAILRKYQAQPHVRERQNKRNRTKHLREFAPVLLADPCSYCGAPADHLDHIVPLARGGENTLDNLTAACGRCNRAKHAKSLLAFLIDTR